MGQTCCCCEMRIDNNTNNELRIKKDLYVKLPGNEESFHEDTKDNLIKSKDLESIEIKEDYVEFLDENNTQDIINNKKSIANKTNVKNYNDGKLLFL